MHAAYSIETKGWTKEQVLAAVADSLKGATMPNGPKYEDWLKSKGRGERMEAGGSFITAQNELPRRSDWFEVPSMKCS